MSLRRPIGVTHQRARLSKADQAERIVKIELEDGSRVEYDYDEWDRLIAERTVGRSGWQGPFTNTVSYEYDVAGNRTAKRRGGTTVTYAYSNGCDRLVGWNAASTDGYAVAASLNVAGYASEAIVTNPNLGYLWVSNRAMATPVTLGATNFLAWGFPVRDGTNEFRVSVSDLAGNAAQAVCTSIVQLATNAAYGFSAAGCVTNLRYWCAAYTNETALRWDGQYRLRSVATNGTDVERNGYDAYGRRVWSWDGTATNWYVHAGPHVVAETDSAGVLRRGYFYAEGVDDALAMSVHTGAVAQIFYYIKDHLGSVHGLVDTNGVVVESYRYDAWGRVLGVYDAKGAPRERSAYGNRILWQGREYSWNTGLYYFRARWYDPVTGRWLSNDPIGISGGLNQYVSCANNPVNFRDRFGLCTDDDSDPWGALRKATEIRAPPTMWERTKEMWAAMGGMDGFISIGMMSVGGGGGAIGRYDTLARSTRGFAGEIQAHKLVEARHLRAWGRSSLIREAPAEILTRSEHQAVTRALQQELPYGDVYTREAALRAYEKVYSSRPEWIQAVIDFFKGL